MFRGLKAGFFHLMQRWMRHSEGNEEQFLHSFQVLCHLILLQPSGCSSDCLKWFQGEYFDNFPASPCRDWKLWDSKDYFAPQWNLVMRRNNSKIPEYKSHFLRDQGLGHCDSGNTHPFHSLWSMREAALTKNKCLTLKYFIAHSKRPDLWSCWYAQSSHLFDDKQEERREGGGLGPYLQSFVMTPRSRSYTAWLPFGLLSLRAALRREPRIADTCILCGTALE